VLLHSLLALNLAFAAQEAETREVVVSTQFRAGALHRFFLGDDYRDLWATPVQVEVLDLQREAGGLTPVRRVGGQQTKGLALRGADGRSYTFRSLEKDPSELLGGEFADLRGTVVEDLLRDQMAGQHPGSEVVAAALGRAAGLHVPQWRLVVMPDAPELGEFRADFAGAVGAFATFPTDGFRRRDEPVAGPMGAPSDHSDLLRPQTPDGFDGALEIIDHFEMARRLQAGEARPDPRAWLRARLLDLTIGDWDRHRKQWRWARFAEVEHFQPIPEDRDQAFSRYEGRLLDMARRTDPRPQAYGPRFPHPLGITFNARDQDRRLLAGFSRQEFVAEARALAAALTDAVLDAAVERLPAEWRAIDGPRLLAALRGRRDALPVAAADFHAFLAKRVDVYLTDRPERATARFAPDGALTLEAGTDAAPLFRRTFDPRETEEVRLYLLGGDDDVRVDGRGPIRLRVIGGDGHDRLDDAAGGGTRFYDDPGSVVAAGPGTRHDARPYTVPPGPKNAPWIPPRDWGRRTTAAPWLSYGSELGAFVGYGLRSLSFGFREHPWARRHVLRGGWSFGSSAPRLEYRGEWRLEGGDTLLRLDARLSGVDKVRFHGYGNESPSAPWPDPGVDPYRSSSDELMLAPALVLSSDGPSSLAVGPVFEFSEARLSDALLADGPAPYGAGRFAALGVRADWRFDRRDRTTYPTRGGLLAARAGAYPRLLDVRSAYGFLEGEATALASAGPLTFAGRVGGRRLLGEYPLTAAAYLGGTGLEVLGSASPRVTVRGLEDRRYAGDASLFANAELRVPLFRATLLVPTQWGVFAFVDSGRIWHASESSRRWHTGRGGGLWFSVLRHFATFSAYVARSEGHTSVSVKSGFAF
jgi:hypothetical protein